MSNATPSLAAEAYRVVRQRILRGELSLGQVISRRKLATELGMSFLPVSEALQRLEVEGLLESRPRAGTRVRIPTRDDVRGHFVVREALEVQAAMLFARVATAGERTDLRKLAARVDALASRPDRTLYTVLHHKLHRRIAECARCSSLTAGERTELRKLAARVDALASRPDRTLYTVLHHKLHRRIAECARCSSLTDVIEKTHALSSIWFSLLRQAAPTDPPRRHQELAAALTAGTPEEAAQATREHIAVGLERTLETLEPYFRLRRVHRETFVRSERKQRLQGIVPADQKHSKVRYQSV